jgi:1,4-dihydroxy-2-naphthoyl-CoA synthase
MAKEIHRAGEGGDVLYERRDDGIAIVTLDRPERGNALRPGMMRTFRAIWEEVRDDPEIRVAILTAAGEKHFWSSTTGRSRRPCAGLPTRTACGSR